MLWMKQSRRRRYGTSSEQRPDRAELTLSHRTTLGEPAPARATWPVGSWADSVSPRTHLGANDGASCRERYDGPGGCLTGVPKPDFLPAPRVTGSRLRRDPDFLRD